MCFTRNLIAMFSWRKLFQIFAQSETHRLLVSPASQNRLQFVPNLWKCFIFRLRNMKSFFFGHTCGQEEEDDTGSVEFSLTEFSFLCWPLRPVVPPTFFIGFLPCHSTLTGHFSFRLLRILYSWQIFCPMWECDRWWWAGQNLDSGLPILIKLQFILLQYLSPPGHMEQAI